MKMIAWLRSVKSSKQTKKGTKITNYKRAHANDCVISKTIGKQKKKGTKITNYEKATITNFKRKTKITN